MSVTLTDADRLDAPRRLARPRCRRPSTRCSFPMAHEDGEWRIAQAPERADRPGVVVRAALPPGLAVLLRPDRADPGPGAGVRARAASSWPRTLTKALLLGPGAGPGPGRRAASSRPASSVGLSVPVSDDGVADIALKGDAGQLTPQAIELMMAQLAWTLRQDPSIRALRVSIDGEPLPLPGGVSAFRVDAGAEYDPAGFQASPLLYGLRDGLLVAGPPERPRRRSTGRSATTDYGARARSASTSTADRGRRRLRRRQRRCSRHRSAARSAACARSSAAPTDLLRPAWDFADRLWLVDRTADGARVSYVEGDRAHACCACPGITGPRGAAASWSRATAPAWSPSCAGRRRRRARGQPDRATTTRAGCRARPGPGRSPEGDGDLRGSATSPGARPTSVAVLSVLTDELSQVRTVSVDGSPPGLDSLSTTLRGRVRALAGSPVAPRACTPSPGASLLDLSTADRRRHRPRPGPTPRSATSAERPPQARDRPG